MKEEESKLEKENEIESNLDEINYPSQEDIYNQATKDPGINPEKITNDQDIAQEDGAWNENTITDQESDLGADLDVPGSELDDQQEAIGSEDEENNYYSESDNL